MDSSIGIVGSGVSGLHLGLFLLANDVPVTMYAHKEPEEIRRGRLLNTVDHHHHTLERVQEGDARRPFAKLRDYRGRHRRS